MRLLILLSLLSSLLGCSELIPRGSEFHHTGKPAIDPNKAIVYIYRVGQGAEFKIGAINISVNDKKIFSVLDEGFTWISLEPGPRTFKAEWSWDEKPLFEEGHFDPKLLDLNVAAGKIYYINYRIKKDNKPITYIESTSLLGKAFSKSHVMSVDFVSEDEPTALRSLTFCNYQTNYINSP